LKRERERERERERKGKRQNPKSSQLVILVDLLLGLPKAVSGSQTLAYISFKNVLKCRFLQILMQSSGMDTLVLYDSLE
jgi:hypothetical protein